MKLLCPLSFAALAACHTPGIATSNVAFASDSGVPTLRSLPARADGGARGRVSAGVEVGAGAGSSGSLFALEAEIPLGEKVAIVPRLLRYSYSWEGEGDQTDDAEEDGDGSGIGAEFRFYPRGALDGFYAGAGVGLFPLSDWEYRDGGTVRTGDSASFSVYGATGYMFRLGERFVIGPTAIVGSYISDSPESGPFAGVGVRFGINF